MPVSLISMYFFFFLFIFYNKIFFYLWWRNYHFIYLDRWIDNFLTIKLIYIYIWTVSELKI
jgi:hypothetical protein